MKNLLERLNEKYHPEPNSGCWLWLYGNDPLGYGRFWNGEKQVGAHRFVYELYKGTIPARCDINHLCRTPCCVNPDHLEAVTHRENCIRGDGPQRSSIRMQQPGMMDTMIARMRTPEMRELSRKHLTQQNKTEEKRKWLRNYHASRTHCKYGHELNEKNVRLKERDGYIFRICRICAKLLMRAKRDEAYLARQREKDRRAYRLMHGKPVDAPVRKYVWKKEDT